MVSRVVLVLETVESILFRSLSVITLWSVATPLIAIVEEVAVMDMTIVRISVEFAPYRMVRIRMGNSNRDAAKRDAFCRSVAFVRMP
mmetsp:Transcript_34250/g.98643  ORF Transcript_34250/g.98643 Transcript_34250/m.98643 type:complete len:87 (-) Transcript_34250:1214-1474(-)